MAKIETITLTKLFRSDKDKEGKPLISKSGKSYEKLAIKASEYGDRWLSGFGNKGNSYWKEGDQVDVVIEAVQDGKYLNFSMPDVWDKIKEFEGRLSWLEETLLDKSGKAPIKAEEKPEDLPF